MLKPSAGSWLAMPPCTPSPCSVPKRQAAGPTAGGLFNGSPLFFFLLRQLLLNLELHGWARLTDQGAPRSLLCLPQASLELWGGGQRYRAQLSVGTPNHLPSLIMNPDSLSGLMEQQRLRVKLPAMS